MTDTSPAAVEAVCAALDRDVANWIDLEEGKLSGDAAALIRALAARNARLEEALHPFAEPHFMGDLYVQFAPRLLVAARAALSEKE